MMQKFIFFVDDSKQQHEILIKKQWELTPLMTDIERICLIGNIPGYFNYTIYLERKAKKTYQEERGL